MLLLWQQQWMTSRSPVHSAYKVPLTYFAVNGGACYASVVLWPSVVKQQTNPVKVAGLERAHIICWFRFGHSKLLRFSRQQIFCCVTCIVTCCERMKKMGTNFFVFYG
jgi:hypothetical protein